MLVLEGQTGTLPPERILASRDAIAKTSPPFLDKICCLLGVLGNMEFEFVTFDCYGTLIDWESGIRRAFKQALEGTRLSATQERELFELYQEEEKRIEGEMPYRKYGEVLALAASAAARKFGKTLPEKLSTILAEQLPS